jgi:exosortase A-associated hydrolase 1
MRETPFRFECEGSSLVGLLHLPEEPTDLGVLMFVGGGPQYRAGGHRQLVLWARELAAQGVPVMRFDYRGVGDSGGEFRGFDHIEADMRAAIQAFFTRLPTVRKLVLWGECDASSAILMHAYKEPRVIGISLQNPWARTTAGQARAYINHYYLRRLTERSFWKKVFALKFNPLTAASSLLQTARRAWSPAPAVATDTAGANHGGGDFIAERKVGCKAYRRDAPFHERTRSDRERVRRARRVGPRVEDAHAARCGTPDRPPAGRPHVLLGRDAPRRD